jgi:HK97 family phage major capsid protein
MPNSAQLITRGKELAAKLTEIETSEAMSDGEKAAAFDLIAKDFESHQLAVNNSERAQEFRAKLGGGGDENTKGVEDDLPPMYCSNLRGKRAAIAQSFMRSAGYRNAIHDLGGPKGIIDGAKSQFDHKFELATKDATSAGNLMGEGLYGGTGPTAAGQSPFLPGAFGPGIQPMFIPGVVEQRFFELTIADLFTSVPTTSPDVTYLVESAANFQSTSVAEGAAYPFSSEQFARVYEQLGKVANAATVTDELLRDAPQLFNFLQGRLVEGIQRAEEVQLLAGSGYPGVNGLLTRSTGFTQHTNALTAMTSVAFPAAGTAGAGVQPASIASLTPGMKVQGTGTTGTPPDGIAIAEAIAQAIVDIQLSIFYSPNAILINPNDFHTIRMVKDGNKQYYGGSMFGADYGYGQNEGNGFLGMPGQRIWNTRVVQTPVIPAGLIAVGYFGPESGYTLRREGISVQMTNSNGTDFVNGKVTMRAEERLGLAITRPKAFELIQLVNA